MGNVHLFQLMTTVSLNATSFTPPMRSILIDFNGDILEPVV